MYATSGSGRVMNSPSRGTIRSWPFRPGKYARANISRKRRRAAAAVATAGSVRRIRRPSLPKGRLACWPETVPAIVIKVRARRAAPQAVNFEEMAKVRGGVMAPANWTTVPGPDPAKPQSLRPACISQPSSISSSGPQPAGHHRANSASLPIHSSSSGKGEGRFYAMKGADEQKTAKKI